MKNLPWLIQSGIREIDQMDGYEFEYYLELLFKKLGYQVKRSPSSNHFGADLILEGETRIVVQAKRYKNKVGIKAVQEINSARDYYSAQEAWVITNNFFTSPAIKLSSSTNVKLIERYELVNLILNSENALLDTSNY
ncbi:MAG: restriction endonuclease [Bacillota bacterium]